MTHFKYVGTTMSGKRKTGFISASSQREGVLKLREKGIAISSIHEVEESIFNKDLALLSKVSIKDFVIYLRQFATLLRSGISLAESTNILSKQSENKLLQKALEEIREDLQTGKTFSDSAAKHPKVFPPIFVNMIRAGEASGQMEETLERLASYFEKQYKTRQKVISALSYPVIVSIIAVGVVIFLLSSVVPTFATMLTDLGGDLPLVTKIVLGASEFVQSFWWLIIILITGVVIAINILRKRESAKYYFDYALLKMPIFGGLLRKAALARMSRTLSSLFSSSVPILQAMTIVEKVVGNEVVGRVLRSSRNCLESGQPLTEPMRDHWAFPPLVVQMISIGEETAALDEMLDKVADFYEMEVENTTDRLKSLIEPIMIVLLAVLVGIIVMAIMLPMFEIYGQI